MPALVGLGIVVVLLLLWIAWFLWAPITQYEVGTLVGTTREGRLVAEFPSHAFEAIWQGQAAYIHPLSIEDAQTAVDGSSPLQNTPVAIPAVVANILGPPANEHFRVSLSIRPNADTAALLDNSLTGEVTVEVEQVSPAELVARASGQFINSPTLSFSPQ